MNSENTACCSHSIVAYSKVSNVDGSVSDAWACCDCGQRFVPNFQLPSFAPEPSHLHVKLAECAAELERERLRLAACGVAALGYFEGCADEYRSASLDDVLRLRKRLDEMENAIAAEREACAEIAEETAVLYGLDNPDDYDKGCMDCAAAIRARGDV
jgi:hypothetical protein